MIPFRTRQALLRLLTSLLIIAMVLVIVFLCWAMWLKRYVVYTRDGAVLDFGVNLEFPDTLPTETPNTTPTINIVYDDDAITPPTNTNALTQLSGYHVTEAMLQGDIAAISQQIQALPAGTPIMLDVKNIRGDFLYDSQLGQLSDNVNREQLGEMISTLHNQGYYLIARLPAFRDYWFGLNNVSNGLFVENKQYLWMDEDRCYWLNPTTEGTQNYLLQIVAELKGLGFNEILFYDFCIPDTDKIHFPEDRAAVIAQAALNLVKSCATDTFAISFTGKDAAFPLPEGRTRLYFEGIAAAGAAALAAQLQLENPAVQLVYIYDVPHPPPWDSEGESVFCVFNPR